jgi:hypothetical protein
MHKMQGFRSIAFPALFAFTIFMAGRFSTIAPLFSPATVTDNNITFHVNRRHDQQLQNIHDLLPHLADCDRPQSPLSLQQLAQKYKPTKFVGYAHSNYDRIYPFYMERHRWKKFRMLEIGLDTGSGSLLWQEYFPCAELYGLEYNADKTKTSGASSIRTIQGDQGNQTFLEGDFLKQADGGRFDIVVDDGGHHYEQQATSYRVLFEKALNPGGLYIIEDIETSYWKKGKMAYGNPLSRGGQSEPETLVNQFKRLVDVGT